MKYLKQSWNYLLAEPFRWLFYCFYQPDSLIREWKIPEALGHALPMLRLCLRMFRLALPIFFLSYPLALIGRLFLLKFSLISSSNGMSFWLASAEYDVICILAASLLNIVGGIILSIVNADAIGIADIIAFSTILSVMLGFSNGIMGTILEVLMIGIILAVAGMIAGRVSNLAVSTFIAVGIIIAIGGAIAIGIGGVILGGIAIGIGSGIVASADKITFGGENYPTGLILGILISIAVGISVGITSTVKDNIGNGIAFGILEIAIVLVSFISGFYRLIFYLFSYTSLLRAYFVSQRDPKHVFSYLHRSGLYWDQIIMLPLPNLKNTLLIATKQNTEETLKEISFIAQERPSQIRAAYAVALEIALNDLKMRDTMRAIAQASGSLNMTLPYGTILIDPRWTRALASLKDASQDAARYMTPSSRKVRRDAVNNMLANLKKISPRTVSRDTRLNGLLGEVVKKWEAIAQQELERLEKVLLTTGEIDNPYTAGPALKRQNSPFVGRRDLAQQLEKALNKESRPTFFLHGERRMGKSSTLNQLPYLLGTSYLPIFFDLQSRGITSSINAFLTTISKEISGLMASKGIKVRGLDYGYGTVLTSGSILQQASRRNEATVYTFFDEWLVEIERILEQEDRTVLLAFDEFEKLEEAERDGFINLRLLLDWFRSVIQNHPRVALLFSGVKTLREMGNETGINWAGYFVNVETLRVSFLQRQEAFQLITRPVPDYPSEEIFGEGVVYEIIRTTGCHPFLVQALCSRLVDNLNTANRERAELQDVSEAVNQVLDSWWDTYFLDLWQRTNLQQQACLFAVKRAGQSDISEIVQQSGLDEKTVRDTLQTLLRRDLILQENGSYRMAAPIFAEWVERNK